MFPYLVRDLEFLDGDLSLQHGCSVDIRLSRHMVLLLEVKLSNPQIDLHLELSTIHPVRGGSRGEQS